MNIEIRNLSKSYFLNGKEIPVLKDISCIIAKGDLISMTGPSGVGKSTFLHVVGTLDAPTKGFVFFDGQQVHRFLDAKIASFRNHNIGYVFQFHHLMAEFTALENVTMPLLMRRMKNSDARKKAEQVLSYVGLAHRMEHKPGELSGGEQQRVALARALAHDPTLLLADEPTGNLDEKTGEEIVDLIRRFNSDYGTTVILVTHNRRISDSFPTRMVLDTTGLRNV